MNRRGLCRRGGARGLALGLLGLAALPGAAVHAQEPRRAPARQLAFPGAEGFGRFAAGARGGTVYHVTNLGDGGTGSLRDAVSQPGRTVVFDQGGVIRIGERIAVAPRTYIAGQAAPGDGITLYGNGLSFSNANDAIVRFIRIRMGQGGSSGKDAVTIAEGRDLMFDHISPAPFEAPPIAPRTAAQAFAEVMRAAGASLRRDEVDRALLAELGSLGRQGAIIRDERVLPTAGPGRLDGGTTPLDRDRDGMPDAWERARGLDPDDPEDRNGDPDGNGYTNLEEYLHLLAGGS